MLFRTHVLFGLLCGTFLIKILNPANSYLFFALLLLGAIFPDIDTPTSKLQKKTGGLLKPIALLFSHRGIFHSLFAAVLLALIPYSLLNHSLGIAFFIGYLSHIVSDGLTKKGVNLFSPIIKLELRGPIETGSIAEIILDALLIVLIYFTVKSVYF